jgi:hypothetical protein
MSVMQVRVIIPDTQAPYIFTDDEIQAYLDIEKGNVLRAAALAIETNASVLAENYISVRTDDLAVNGASAAEALLKRARALRERADAADDSSDIFMVVPFGGGCRCEYAEHLSCGCV